MALPPLVGTTGVPVLLVVQVICVVVVVDVLTDAAEEPTLARAAVFSTPVTLLVAVVATECTVAAVADCAVSRVEDGVGVVVLILTVAELSFDRAVEMWTFILLEDMSDCGTVTREQVDVVAGAVVAELIDVPGEEATTVIVVLDPVAVPRSSMQVDVGRGLVTGGIDVGTARAGSATLTELAPDDV